MAARSPALLVVEVEQLELLAQHSQAQSSDAPLLLRRLAEDHVELERAAASAGKAALARQAGEAAVRDYASLLARYPDDPKADEARYFLALEHERRGDPAAARRAYFELIAKSPDSRLVPLAYLAFAELFLAEGKADPGKLALAALAYDKVAQSPPPKDAASGWAWLRKAQILERQGDRDGARTAYRHAADFAAAHPTLAAEQGLREELPAWALEGDGPDGKRGPGGSRDGEEGAAITPLAPLAPLPTLE